MNGYALIITILLFTQLQANAVVSWNCFEPQYENTRVSHKQYYGEDFIEPYRWGNPTNKPWKQWYQDKMEIQRKEIKEKWEHPVQFNANGLYNHSFWK